MESVKLDRQRGQILVTVAIMAVAIFAFVALAVDVGQIYGGRRRMQNAADAGALAGARAICFEQANEDQAKAAAEDYAQRNGADPDQVDVNVDPDDRTVHVVAGQTLDTFFAGVIGIRDAHVGAEAEAICGPLVAGGTLPLAFDVDVFFEEVECGEEFVLFDDKSKLDCAEGDEQDYCNDELCADFDYNICSKCDCGIYGPHLGPGQYNWVELPAFEHDYYEIPDDTVCKGGGANWTECWVQYNYPPLIEVGDCLLRESGVQESVLKAVNEYRKDDYVNIILWDDVCDPDAQVPKYYKVAAFGCVQVIEYISHYDVPECGSDSACQNGRNNKIIRVKRICEESEGWDACRDPQGGAAPGGPSEAFGVSLTK